MTNLPTCLECGAVWGEHHREDICSQTGVVGAEQSSAGEHYAGTNSKEPVSASRAAGPLAFHPGGGQWDQTLSGEIGPGSQPTPNLHDHELCKACYQTKTALAQCRADLAPSEDAERPTIVCLCGSTRFKDAFDEAIYTETMAGRIVLSVGFYMHATGNRHGEQVGATPEQKIALDELHKRKIDLADEVLILNVGGYVGSSTQSELDYAIAHGKRVRWLEDAAIDKVRGKT